MRGQGINIRVGESGGREQELVSDEKEWGGEMNDTVEAAADRGQVQATERGKEK